MDDPTLPIIGSPMLWQFHFLEFLPTAFFLAVMFLLTMVYIAILFESYIKICCTKLEKLIHINCWQCFCKWADGQLGIITTVAFPNLFSIRHISVASDSELESANNEQHVQAGGRRLVKEILFLDRATKFGTYTSRQTSKYSGKLVRVFGILGSIILLFSAMAFFRYFPVTLGTECVEEDGKSYTWFCYYANANSSDQAINCTLYNNNPPDESNSSALICYAISGELAKSSAAALGLYKISSACVCVVVYIALKWNRWCGKVREKLNKKRIRRYKTCQCITHKYCCTLVYSLSCYILFTTIGIFLLYTYVPNSISSEYTSNHYLTGEFVYRFSIVYVFIFLGIFSLVMPFTLIFYKGMNSSYYFLASEGEEKIQTTESDSGSNNGYDEI